MKKKTKFRLRNNLTVPFWVVVILCLIGAILSSDLFYTSFSRALTKLNEEPIAEITFKYKTAQRKFIDRTVWDRLRQYSPVYNGDTIHTAALSEAVIHFPDGTTMDLAENTMAQIFISQDKTLLAELQNGEASFDTSESENGITVSSGGIEVQVQSGSSLSARSDKDSDSSLFQVLDGTAVLSNGQSLTQGEVFSVEEGNATVPSLAVLMPRPNSRILYHHEGKEKIRFVWRSQNIQEEQKVKLQISKNKDFSKTSILLEEDVTGLEESEYELDSGNYYWRYLLDEVDSASGKVQVIQSLAPNLIAPVEKYEYAFRTRLPAVRLIWSESPYAASYRLTIADNSRFANPIIEQRASSTSSIISSLSEGNYWWKVEPFYQINKEGYSCVSETGRFSITKKGELNSPELFVPAVNGIVNSAAESGSVSFSWKQENEAVSYDIVISETEDLSKVIDSVQVRENFYRMPVSRFAREEGKYFWAVTQTDSEGNKSHKGEVRSFYSMKGNPEQHIIEPADNFQVAQSLLQDTKFTWKKNLGVFWETEFQVSSDDKFRNIIFSEKTENLSTMIPELKVGNYFWRIVSKNSVNEAVLVSSVRKFSVLGNLEKATLISPATKAIARETIPYAFKWSEVEGADFYKLTIYNDSTDEIVYEDNVYGTETYVDMFNPKEFEDRKNYRYELQAKSIAIPGVSSRRVGNLAEQTFTLIKLKPIEIITPKRNQVFTGVDAIMNPSFATWNSVDEVDHAQFVLIRKGEEDEIVFKTPSDEDMTAQDRSKKTASRRVLLDTEDGLRDGDYEIIVYAETLDGIDISNSEEKYKGKFSILPVEPLPQVFGLKASPELFDEKYLSVPSNPKRITLSWDPVKGATDYLVTIGTDERKSKKIVDMNITGTSFQIDFTSMTEEQRRNFAKGKFVFTVEALRRIDRDEDGVYDRILQRGESSSETFRTNVPEPKRSRAKGARNPYGN